MISFYKTIVAQIRQMRKKNVIKSVTYYYMAFCVRLKPRKVRMRSTPYEEGKDSHYE